MAAAALDSADLLGSLSELGSLDERFLADAGLLEADEADSGGARGAEPWSALEESAEEARGMDEVMELADAAPPFATGAGVAQLRCIDDTHPLNCTKCTPAPLDATSVELVGDFKRKNGEKRLRSLLTRVPEWNLLSERRKLVPLALAAGLAPLAKALEEKKTSALRKAHLIFMARAWGYKSENWVQRHDRAAGRAMAELQRRAQQASQVLPASALPLPRFGDAAVATWGGVWSEGVLAPEAVWLFTQRTLRPLSLRIAGAFAGEEARAAAEAQGAEHITLAAAAEVRKVADMASGPLAQLSALHAMLTAVQRALPPEVAATQASKLLSSPAYAGADAMLRAALDAGTAQIRGVARASSARIARGGLTPSEACWLREMATSHDATLLLLAHVMRVLQAFRNAPMGAFLDVAGQQLELLMVLTTSLGSAASAREAWMHAMIRAREEGALTAGGHAAGERAQLLVCWPVAACELPEEHTDASGSSPSGSSPSGSSGGGSA